MKPILAELVENARAAAASDKPAKAIRTLLADTLGRQEEMADAIAEKARGAMARFVVENRVETLDGLKDFATGGYEFQPAQSEGQKLVFVRDYPEAA